MKYVIVKRTDDMGDTLFVCKFQNATTDKKPRYCLSVKMAKEFDDVTEARKFITDFSLEEKDHQIVTTATGGRKKEDMNLYSSNLHRNNLSEAPSDMTAPIPFKED